MIDDVVLLVVVLVLVYVLNPVLQDSGPPYVPQILKIVPCTTDNGQRYSKEFIIYYCRSVAPEITDEE